MVLIKSFSVGDGDMFYIRHGSDNFTIIDCCLEDNNKRRIIQEIKAKSSDKNIRRFISTHPDDDHIRGLIALDDELEILNFYCVLNEATKPDPSEDFDRYCTLRNHREKAFHIFSGCKRKWMNEESNERGSAGIYILWPVTDNTYHKDALKKAKDGGSPNNISCIMRYKLNGGASVLWLGDLATEFMENIKDAVDLPRTDILFAPHHGRDSGTPPEEWLNAINPKMIIIGEAPSSVLNYYTGYNTITQNSAGDITLECIDKQVLVYVSEEDYSVDFLVDEGRSNTHGYYIGTLNL